ncbi:helix-turn-helix domain-containing protein [Dethiosulfovibrio salsuginis]|uniref:DNA binding domain-containing protein, excisionase family n=1 Tax=Dethiosulfovibrio salsuginis TaxID=561720 RepID=A0A1X7JVC6_9BACT|nr:helix-turn-helix domain-containing protein [Dethiosulfovibrio salsuginis]SMG31655.1 DNA binding domain-containing protein, excisionase family [Dethiosulfovibrio salsuginis]
MSEIMTIEELAVYLKISKSSMYKLCQEGKIPGNKVGRHWRFQREVIDSWLADHSVSSDHGSISMKDLRIIVDQAIKAAEKGEPLGEGLLEKIVDDVVGGDSNGLCQD